MEENSAIQVRTYTTAAPFLERAQALLEAREATNNLILGIAIRLREHPDWYSTSPFIATIEDARGLPLLASLMTPPQNLLLGGQDGSLEAAFERLAAHLHASGWPVPGVSAENRLADRFAGAWTQATGLQSRVQMRMRAYELRQVIPPAQPPPGFMRQAGMDDLDLATAWRETFTRESLREEPPPDSREISEHIIQAGKLFLWDDHGPVSMAASARSTPHGETINAVYTPPEYRRRGYASALVAQLSQRLLDAGKLFCALFTDLDYPTSNAIYQRIGYRPVSDFLVYRFEADIRPPAPD